MDFYSLHIDTPAGKQLDMKDFEGKVVLIVNTATQCAFTPQFDGLEQLHQSYKDKGLIVIGTPCNQFAGQEPLADEEMTQTCRVNHGVTFPLTAKIKVNGADTHPLFQFLKSKLGGLFGSHIKWNFTKFLIDRNGKPYKRYAPTTAPRKIEADIKKLLEA